MRHASFAIAFMPRADEDRHVDGHGRLGRVGEEEHLGAVGQLILGDPLDGGHFLDSLGVRRVRGGGGLAGRATTQRDQGGRHNEGRHETNAHRKLPKKRQNGREKCPLNDWIIVASPVR